MDSTKDIIYNLIYSGKNDEAFAFLNTQIKNDPNNDELYYLRGNLFQKVQNWKFAIENYQQAIHLNAFSPAHEMLIYINDILSFYNKDIYNQ